MDTWLWISKCAVEWINFLVEKLHQPFPCTHLTDVMSCFRHVDDNELMDGVLRCRIVFMGRGTDRTLRDRTASAGHVLVLGAHFGRRSRRRPGRLRRDSRQRDPLHHRLRRVAAQRCRHCRTSIFLLGLMRTICCCCCCCTFVNYCFDIQFISELGIGSFEIPFPVMDRFDNAIVK